METDKPKPDKSPIIIALLAGVIIGLVSGYLLNSNSGKTITHSAPATGGDWRLTGHSGLVAVWNEKTGEAWAGDLRNVGNELKLTPVTKK